MIAVAEVGGDSRDEFALLSASTPNPQDWPGLVFCPPAEHREPMSGLAIPFSMWQCAGHGDAAGPGFVR